MKKWQVMASALLAGWSGAATGCGAGKDDTPSGVQGPTPADDSGAPIGSGAGDDDAATGVDAGSPPALSCGDWDGRSDGGGACRPTFASGVNVAWVHFARDVPNPDLPTFQAMFHNVYAAGGRVTRWWFHTNGTATPGYDENGLALPISDANIADVKSILDTARCEHMMVLISLWSFDMLKTNPAQAQNLALLTVDANRQAYIDNVLTPLVRALAGYPGLYGWETFNEPEGMATNVATGARPFTGNGGMSVDESYIQKTVNAFAGAIHDADPSALVTNGTWQFLANATVQGMKNFYSDAALEGVPSARPNGTLDFYEVHYYASNGTSVSPFLHPASYWAVDKPIVIGEFYAQDQDGVAAADTYTHLFGTSYSGAWAWQYLNNDSATNMTKWPTMQVPMQNLYAQSPADLDCP